MSAPMTEEEQIKAKISQLQKLIETDNPGMKAWLIQIHKGLKAQEGIVQLLSEEEIGTLVAGYSRVAQVSLTATVKSGSKNAKALAKISSDDL